MTRHSTIQLPQYKATGQCITTSQCTKQLATMHKNMTNKPLYKATSCSTGNTNALLLVTWSNTANLVRGVKYWATAGCVNVTLDVRIKKHAFTHTFAHIHIQTFTPKHTFACSYIHTHTHIYSHILCSCAHRHTDTSIHTMHTNTQVHTHTINMGKLCMQWHCTSNDGVHGRGHMYRNLYDHQHI